jgi:hypothetical protein
MDRLDEQQALAFTSDFCCAVLGSLDRGFMLVPLHNHGEPVLTEAETERAHANGFSFCGVLGLIDGKCVARCEPGIEAVSLCAAASPDFARLVLERTKDDWLERMYRLPDTRS